jgi:proteasome maturation protein
MNVPILRDDPDLLRNGLNSRAQSSIEVSAEHPVQLLQSTFRQNQDALKQFTMKNIFGEQMAMKLSMERAILSQFQRLPGLPSEFTGLETVMGLDEELGFEDILNDPSESLTPVDLHTAMENKLRMGVSNLHLRA